MMRVSVSESSWGSGLDGMIDFMYYFFSSVHRHLLYFFGNSCKSFDCLFSHLIFILYTFYFSSRHLPIDKHFLSLYICWLLDNYCTAMNKHE